MTTFNSAAVLMPLDDYYDHYVLPKPNIPKHYPGLSGHRKKTREAAHLQSYKDDAEDDDDMEEEEDQQPHIDEVNSSIEDSNMNQINFETNEFNQLYDDQIAKSDKNNNTAVTGTPVESVKCRIKPNNTNGPATATPLVLNEEPRANLQPAVARAGRGTQKFQQQRKRFNRSANNKNNSRNSQQYSVHNRLGYNNSQRGQFPMEQRMRNAYNAFNNNNNNSSNNNGNAQQQVLMNMNNHFQNGHPQINLSNQLNPMQFHNEKTSFNRLNNMIGNQFSCNMNQNESSSNNWTNSNSLTSLINSVNQIGNRYNNALTRLGPPHRNQFDDLPFGNREQPTCSSQLQRISNNGIVVSDSLRLADLMNMDKNSCKNLNVAEVAKNAMLLLSSVYHKPILNEDVQQELCHLQQKSGLPEEPYGVDMKISPESTDLRMYHRFK